MHALQEWRRAREHEIKVQRAVQLEYDWTFTTPYTGTVTNAPMPSGHGLASGPLAGPSSQGQAAVHGGEQPSSSAGPAPQWESTTEQVRTPLLGMFGQAPAGA